MRRDIKPVKHMRRRALRSALVASITGALLALVFALPAAAQENDGVSTNDQIVLNGRLVVPEGQTVDTAVIFNGPVTVDGTVTETVVVFNGDAVISGGVGEDVVVFRGTVLVRSGARIGGDLVTQQTPQVEEGATIGGSRQRIATKFDAERLGIASRMAWWVAYSVSTLILGLLLLLFAPAMDRAIVDAVRNRTGASIGFGVGLFFLVPIAAVIFLVLIVSFPLGLFLLLALALLYTIGFVAGAHALGRLILKPPSSRFVAFLIGWGILRVLALVPFLGGLLWLAAAILGLGALAVAARRASSVEDRGIVSPPAPAPA
ncbi:MAG TPA: polymer-forming cytoskeletal protein [Actinomycetota bacterium]|nr:polymer-forming cytoskeletal protein [Actinomycetota bacterium]